MTRYDRLTALDASFLHMERLEYPMHVGALSVLEGAPFFDDNGHFRIGEVRELVQSRLPLLPRFRRRLMTVPYDQGRPIWIDDDRFDITYHVRHTALPKPGSWEQLVALTTRVQEQLLDRERPLWELWFVEGLEDGHVALDPEDAPLAHRRRVRRRRRDAAPRRDPRLRAARAVTSGSPSRRRARRSSSSTACASARPSRPSSSARSDRCCAVRATRSSAPASSAGRSARWSTASRSRPARRSTRAPVAIVCCRSCASRSPRSRRSARRIGGTVNDVVLAGVGGGLHQLLDCARRRRRGPPAARAVPGVGARRRPARRARQQDLRDLRVAAGRRRPTRSTGSTRSRRRPPTSRRSGRR